MPPSRSLQLQSNRAKLSGQVASKRRADVAHAMQSSAPDPSPNRARFGLACACVSVRLHPSSFATQPAQHPSSNAVPCGRPEALGQHKVGRRWPLDEFTVLASEMQRVAECTGRARCGNTLGGLPAIGSFVAQRTDVEQIRDEQHGPNRSVTGPLTACHALCSQVMPSKMFADGHLRRNHRTLVAALKQGYGAIDD